MADPAATLRALAGACDRCEVIWREGVGDQCTRDQHLALVRALPAVAGWPATADELRTMADTVDRLTRERDEARALLTAAVPVLEFDAVQGGNGDVLTRVRAWLGCPMAEPHDSIRAALDYDVIIRDALAGVPSGAVNDLVERLADVLTPKPRRDPLTDPRPGDVVRFRIKSHPDHRFTVYEVFSRTSYKVVAGATGTDETEDLTLAGWSDWSGFEVEVLHTADEVTP